MNLFGKAAKKGPTAKESITKLRDTIDMLEKREKHILKQMDEQTETAKKNAKTNKKGISARLPTGQLACLRSCVLQQS